MDISPDDNGASFDVIADLIFGEFRDRVRNAVKRGFLSATFLYAV